jgi:hypothetical protein
VITLNSERGLERIENFNDVFDLPGFRVDVDPKSVKLETIIGNYTEKEFVRCGLSSCHTKHGKGYLVKVEDGTLTNIGKDCGKTHFGVDFEAMRRNFDRDIVNMERRENLKSFQSQIPAIRETIADVRQEESGADWVYKSIQQLTKPGKSVPDSIVEVVRKVRHSRNPTLTKPRFATKEEVQQAEVSEHRKIEGPYYIEEPVGNLEGIGALYPENDIRELLILGLEKLLNDIEALDVDSLPSPKLRANVNLSTSADAQLNRARASVNAGRILLRSDNLEVLTQFAEDQNEQRDFQKFLKSLGR